MMWVHGTKVNRLTVAGLMDLNKAFKRVKSNKGVHGVDEMEVDELLQYLKNYGGQLKQSILDGKYHPNPVRRVEIPKDNGENGCDNN